MGPLLATSFDAGTELPLLLAGATAGFTRHLVYVKGGLLEVITPLNLLALPLSPSAPAVLPAGLSERGAWAGGGGRLRARQIGARRAPREGEAVNYAPGGFMPCKRRQLQRLPRSWALAAARPGLEKKLGHSEGRNLGSV